MIGIEELEDRIRDKYDPDDLVDLLNITVDDILAHFGHRITLYRDKFISEEYWEDD
jgi:hypothetical protein